MDIEKRLEAIEARLNGICQRLDMTDGDEQREPGTLELDLTLPEADIDGLHFNETEVHAVFEKQDDGWYHSRDILFMSARNTEEDNSVDILSRYLNSDEFKQAIWEQMPDEITIESVEEIKVALPKENEGVKKYNGADCWYWLAEAYSASAAIFCRVDLYGNTHYYYASAVCGCAPAFCVR
jgi:hypothetical protein